MKRHHQFTDERITETLQGFGCPWREYILVGTPPCICRWSRRSGVSALVIEDADMASAVVEFLRRHGAPSFATAEDVEREYG